MGGLWKKWFKFKALTTREVNFYKLKRYFYKLKLNLKLYYVNLTYSYQYTQWGYRLKQNKTTVHRGKENRENKRKSKEAWKTKHKECNGRKETNHWDYENIKV